MAPVVTAEVVVDVVAVAVAAVAEVAVADVVVVVEGVVHSLGACYLFPVTRSRLAHDLPIAVLRSTPLRICFLQRFHSPKMPPPCYQERVAYFNLNYNLHM